MLAWETFVSRISDDLKSYCEHNDINLGECLKYLKSFIELEDSNADEGLKESFIPNLIKIYDSGLDIHDERNCIDRLIRYEPFLRKLCLMKFPEKTTEIKNLSAIPLLKKLDLIENDLDLENKNNKSFGEDDFNYHLIIMYNSKNDSSHRWESLNEREIYNLRFTISIFYIEVINRTQNLLRNAACLPDETIEYYARYIDKNGIPFGIRKLTEKQVRCKNSSYKFVYKDKKLVKVIHINSFNNPYETDGTFLDPVIQQISYLDENTIKIDCTNSTGRKINFIKEYKRDLNTGTFDTLYYYKGDSNSSYHLLNDEFQQYLQGFQIKLFNTFKANISGYKLKRNSDGYIIKEIFLKYHGENIQQSNKENNYGYEYELNENGLCLKKYFLDKEGKRKKTYKGLCYESYKYNNLYEAEEVSICNKKGEEKYVYKYDDVGNLLQLSVFLNNKRIEKLKLIYNSKGERIEQQIFNGNGMPDYCEYHFHRDVRSYDHNGYFSSAELYGINKNDKVIGCINGAYCWKIVSVFNDYGFEESEEYFDCDGKPILSNTGSAKIEYDYDEAGNLVEERYYGVDGKIKCDNNGIAIVSKKYKNNEIIEELYFDENHKPVINSQLWHKTTFKYYKGELAENIEEISYFGITSKKVNCFEGYATKKIIYNGRGLITDEFFYNEKGDKGASDGVYHTLYEYDNEGNEIKRAYYNKDEKPTCKKDEISNLSYAIYEESNKDHEKIRLFKDEQENLLVKYQLCFDDFGNEILKTRYEMKNSKEKFVYCTKKKYDDYDRCTEQVFTDEFGNIVETPEGGCYICYEYWDDGKEKCRKYFDKNKNLTNIPDLNYAYWIKKYDSYNNITERYFFDINNKAEQIDSFGSVGYKIKYDFLNRPITQSYLDKSNKIIFSASIEYLDDNNCKLTQTSKNGEVTDFATYDINTDWMGTYYLFESEKFGLFKIRTREINEQDSNISLMK